MNKTSWQIWIDTGGTFTDCLALDPEGNLHRAKVLSTSAVRGRIAGVDRDVVHLATAWDLPQGFFRGFTFRLLGRESEPRTVEDSDSTILRLDDPIAGDLAGVAFELRSPEEAPVLAARLVTRTPLSAELPEIAMR
ncbi:MAG TPA: hydantoinase/oxoprolinase N-terminal domain-containing protein, partial [Thermoanaerobaculia bacterium]